MAARPKPANFVAPDPRRMVSVTPPAGFFTNAATQKKVGLGFVLVLGVVALLAIIGQLGGTGESTATSSGGTPAPPSTSAAPAPPPAPALSRQPSETDQAWEVLAAAETAVRSMLRDPESGKFGIIGVYRFKRGGKSVIVACGTVNAKNGFGGYTGSMGFISGGSVESTMMQEANTGKVFAGTWAGACKGSPIVSQRAE